MSLTFRFISSIGLSPVSLLIFSLVDSIRPALVVSISTFCVVGILIAFVSGSYFTGFQFRL